MNRAIYEANQRKYFDRPAAIDQLQLEYARIYFKHLNGHAASSRLPRLWQLASTHQFSRFMPAWLVLFLSIRAHVLVDAPLALARTHCETPVLEADFIAVNDLLVGLRFKVALQYHNGRLLRLLRMCSLWLGFPLIKIILFGWRRTAWFVYSDATGLQLTNTPVRKLQPKIYPFMTRNNISIHLRISIVPHYSPLQVAVTKSSTLLQ